MKEAKTLSSGTDGWIDKKNWGHAGVQDIDHGSVPTFVAMPGTLASVPSIATSLTW
jgi:hypothetical protein